MQYASSPITVIISVHQIEKIRSPFTLETDHEWLRYLDDTNLTDPSLTQQAYYSLNLSYD